jgi:hypothetical protein
MKCSKPQKPETFVIITKDYVLYIAGHGICLYSPSTWEAEQEDCKFQASLSPKKKKVCVCNALGDSVKMVRPQPHCSIGIFQLN